MWVNCSGIQTWFHSIYHRGYNDTNRNDINDGVMVNAIAKMHYSDVIMGAVASQITSLTIVYSTVYSGTDESKHQSFASLAFVRGIQRDLWIPRTKGQLRGKCFHLMTSSWASFWMNNSWRFVWVNCSGIQTCFNFLYHKGYNDTNRDDINDGRMVHAFATMHYSDVIMGTMASQITSLTTVYSTFYSGADENNHQSSASLAFVRGIHRWPANFSHKGPVTQVKFFRLMISSWYQNK